MTPDSRLATRPTQVTGASPGKKPVSDPSAEASRLSVLVLQVRGGRGRGHRAQQPGLELPGDPLPRGGGERAANRIEDERRAVEQRHDERPVERVGRRPREHAEAERPARAVNSRLALATNTARLTYFVTGRERIDIRPNGPVVPVGIQADAGR